MRILLPGIFLCVLLSLVSCKGPAEHDDETKQEDRVQLISNPSTPNSVVPRLYSYDEELYMSWVAKVDSINVLRYAVYDKEGWSAVEAAAIGTDWFVNWADFPVISKSGENLMLSYLEKSSPNTFSYDVYVHFEKPVDSMIHAYGPPRIYEEIDFKLHNDTTKTEHGFVSATPMSNGGFFVTWLDGRKTGGGSHDHDSNGAGPMTLRGAFITSEGDVTDRTELDDRVCDCCQTSAALTTKGPIVAYRDRSDEEIRDISVVRQVDGKWQPSQIIGNDQWEISGCPVNGPSIATNKNFVSLAWFTAVGGEGKVQLVFSDDDGKTFGDPIRIDAGNATGRVDVEMLNEEEAVVIWMEPKEEEEHIRLVRVNINGSKDIPITVSRTSAERASGFPQIEKLDDRLVLAWTVAGDEASTIQTAEILIKNLMP